MAIQPEFPYQQPASGAIGGFVVPPLPFLVSGHVDVEVLGMVKVRCPICRRDRHMKTVRMAYGLYCNKCAGATSPVKAVVLRDIVGLDEETPWGVVADALEERGLYNEAAFIRAIEED